MKSATPSTKKTKKKETTKEELVQQELDKTYLLFEFRNKAQLYIVPEEIKAVGGHVTDGSQTRLYVSGLNEQLVTLDRPENVVKRIAEFRLNKAGVDFNAYKSKDDE